MDINKDLSRIILESAILNKADEIITKKIKEVYGSNRDIRIKYNLGGKND